jgi:hypothetical protein
VRSISWRLKGVTGKIWEASVYINLSSQSGGVPMNETTYRLGFWIVVFSGISGILYEIAALAELTGILEPPISLAYILTPSLPLALSFPAVISCVFDVVPLERKIWARLGLVLILVYSTINSIVYFSQLTVVIPQILAGQSEEVDVLIFEPGKFMYAINGLAYGLMSLGTLFTAFAFDNNGIQRWVRWSMIAHGVLAPFIVGALFVPAFFAIGAFWLITFPVMMISLALMFLRKGK